MRIIGGKYRHKRFDVPHTFKARPTTDFAKESLFNILHNVYVDFDAAPTALDLFAGTGSISLELLSRGCSRVVSVEKDFQHWQFLRRTAQALNDEAWVPLHADVFRYLKAGQAPAFDIIFADPPYALPNLTEIPDLVFASGLLREKGLFVLEHGKRDSFASHPRFAEHRAYGSVNFSFFE